MEPVYDGRNGKNATKYVYVGGKTHDRLTYKNHRKSSRAY